MFVSAGRNEPDFTSVRVDDPSNALHFVTPHSALLVEFGTVEKRSGKLEGPFQTADYMNALTLGTGDVGVSALSADACLLREIEFDTDGQLTLLAEIA